MNPKEIEYDILTLRDETLREEHTTFTRIITSLEGLTQRQIELFEFAILRGLFHEEVAQRRTEKGKDEPDIPQDTELAKSQLLALYNALLEKKRMEVEAQTKEAAKWKQIIDLSAPRILHVAANGLRLWQETYLEKTQELADMEQQMAPKKTLGTKINETGRKIYSIFRRGEPQHQQASPHEQDLLAIRELVEYLLCSSQGASASPSSPSSPPLF